MITKKGGREGKGKKKVLGSDWYSGLVVGEEVEKKGRKGKGRKKKVLVSGWYRIFFTLMMHDKEAEQKKGGKGMRDVCFLLWQ